MTVQPGQIYEHRKAKERLMKKTLKEYLDKGVKVMSEAAEVAVHLKANPGPVGLMAVGARVLNAVNEVMDEKANDFFRKWRFVHEIHPLSEFIFMICKSSQLLTKEGVPKNSALPKDDEVYTATIHGQRIGWTDHGSWKEGPYCAPDCDPEKARDAMRILLWETVGTSVKFHQPPLGSDARLSNDNLDETFPSKTAQALWSKEQKFIKAGRRRAILVYGEPGVGKSNIIRHIADLAGGLRLRLRARDLEDLRSLGQLITFLQPSAVLIDDLDRARNPDGILEEFDEIKSKAKLLLVTVNVLSKLDPAALRRFDDWYHIEKLDDEVLGRLLNGIDPDIAARLQDMPITYISRYREMHEDLGAEEAAKALDGLVQRREMILKLLEEAQSEGDDSRPLSEPKQVKRG